MIDHHLKKIFNCNSVGKLNVIIAILGLDGIEENCKVRSQYSIIDIFLSKLRVAVVDNVM